MITVTALGTIVEDNPHFITSLLGKPIVIPDGFSVERPVWDASVSGSEATSKKKTAPHVYLTYKTGAVNPEEDGADSAIPRFHATVQQSEAGQPPLITIVRSDDPEHKRYSSAKGHAVAWREALQDAAKDFPDKTVSDAKSPNGFRLMGLQLAEVVAEVRALPGGEAAFAKAEAALATRKADVAVVVEESASVQSTPGVTVTGTKPGGKRSKAAPKATASAKSTEVPAATAAEAGAKPRRSRKADAVTATAGAAAAPASTTTTTAAPKEVNFVCPDCGLAGTPFCAATGKPHEAAPCPKCGLTSAFCPVTGEAHSGAIQRVNRERGEVHLPGARRRTTKKTAAAAATTGEGVTADTAVAIEGTPVKTASRPKRPAATAAGEAVAAVEGGVEGTTDESEAGKKKRRTRSSKAAAAATAAGADGTPGTRQPTLAELAAASAGPNGADGTATAAATAAAAPPHPPEPSLLDIALKDPDVYIYPTLRPPLTQTEQRRALHCMEQKWQEKASEAMLPTSAHALPIPLIPVKRRAAGPAGNAGRRRKKAKTEGDEDAPTKDENDDDEDNNNNNDEDAEETGGGSGGSHGTDGPAEATIMMHPLEVRDITTSGAGKRLTKFLWQYTSERSKFDLLRAQNAASGAGKASGATGDDKAKTDETVKSEEAASEEASTQALSDRQRTDSLPDVAAAIASTVLQGTSEMTLPRTESV